MSLLYLEWNQAEGLGWWGELEVQVLKNSGQESSKEVVSEEVKGPRARAVSNG